MGMEASAPINPGPRSGRQWLEVVRPAGRDPLRVVLLSPSFRAWHTHWDPERGARGGSAPHVEVGCYHCSVGRALKMDGFIHAIRQTSGGECLVHLTLHAMVDLLTLRHPDHGLRGTVCTFQRLENRSNGRVCVHSVSRADVTKLPTVADFRPDVCRLLGVPNHFPLAETLCVLAEEGGAP